MAEMRVDGVRSYTGRTHANTTETLLKRARDLLRAEDAPPGRYVARAKGMQQVFFWEGREHARE